MKDRKWAARAVRTSSRSGMRATRPPWNNCCSDGFAYRDYALPEELQAERAAAEAEKRPYTYSRRWMAETEAEAARWEAAGRQAVVRLKMPRTGACRFHDRIRGDVEFQWAQEQDHVIQRADGSCLYHLASVVDDQDFAITHVIRAVEHLSNTPRQVFIAQSLGYPLPEYAHLPYVAEPGSSNKLSKTKARQVSQESRLQEAVRSRTAHRGRHRPCDQRRDVQSGDRRFLSHGRLSAAALVNYLLLLGWSLDDKTEQFTREEMIRHFSLERVNKSPASFDPLKLWAFQQRDMMALPHGAEGGAAWCPSCSRPDGCRRLAPPPRTTRLRQVALAAGDRIKTAGDILDYPEFFCAADQLAIDAKDFDKRVRQADAGRAAAPPPRTVGDRRAL